ncbi:NUDIX hydrolase [Tessaracoccus coleopterorum]|nr:hypothetical protein [Tessaracoccus coleopterorum]
MQQKFFVTVDLVVLTIRDGRLHALLIERRFPPFEGNGRCQEATCCRERT